MSSYSFRGVSAETIFFWIGNPKVTVHKCAETIQGRKLYEEIRYLAKNICYPLLPQQKLNVPKLTNWEGFLFQKFNKKFYTKNGKYVDFIKLNYEMNVQIRLVNFINNIFDKDSEVCLILLPLNVG